MDLSGWLPRLGSDVLRDAFVEPGSFGVRAGGRLDAGPGVGSWVVANGFALASADGGTDTGPLPDWTDVRFAISEATAPPQPDGALDGSFVHVRWTPVNGATAYLAALGTATQTVEGGRSVGSIVLGGGTVSFDGVLPELPTGTVALTAGTSTINFLGATFPNEPGWYAVLPGLGATVSGVPSGSTAVQVGPATAASFPGPPDGSSGNVSVRSLAGDSQGPAVLAPYRFPVMGSVDPDRVEHVPGSDELRIYWAAPGAPAASHGLFADLGIGLTKLMHIDDESALALFSTTALQEYASVTVPGLLANVTALRCRVITAGNLTNYRIHEVKVLGLGEVDAAPPIVQYWEPSDIGARFIVSYDVDGATGLGVYIDAVLEELLPVLAADGFPLATKAFEVEGSGLVSFRVHRTAGISPQSEEIDISPTTPPPAPTAAEAFPEA